ncbi:MAG: phosphonate C-P lyase system protein PhnH [Rhodobacter sp.]|nr:phosphonate C-P lyase system protein PhnH [Rhodobacter sp.]
MTNPLTAETLGGGFDDAPIQSARAFRAALDAMARPGRIHVIAGARPPAPLSVAAGTLLLTLADGTTPVHLAGDIDCDALRGWITFHTAAPLVPAEAAVFAVGRWADLTPARRFAIGTPEYPDRAATLIVEMPVLKAEGPVLTGPGIRDRARLTLPEPEAFRANHALFPLGFDTFLTCGNRVAGLPRSTRVEDF